MLPAFVTISEGFWDSEKKHMACIPQKINGWNLTRHPWKRKIFYKKPSFSGSIKLVGGWTNPSEKYARQIGNLPQIGHLGVKIKSYLKPPPVIEAGYFNHPVEQGHIQKPNVTGSSRVNPWLPKDDGPHGPSRRFQGDHPIPMWPLKKRLDSPEDPSDFLGESYYHCQVK